MAEPIAQGAEGERRVALVGAGLMGSALIRRLVGRGYTVSLYNRTGPRAAALEGPQVEVVSTPAEALTRAERLLLVLSDAGAIRSVVLTAEARPHLTGHTLIQMGTISPSQSRQLAAEFAAAGAAYLEAPVLGSTPEAEAGGLLVMVGGDAHRFEEQRELLSCFGPRPLLIGPVGQAAALKLALNQLIAGLTSAFALSLGLVRSQGVAVEQFMEVLRQSALYAPTFDKKLRRMLERDFFEPNFPTKHLHKDVGLILEEAHRGGLRTEVLEAIYGLLAECLVADQGESDYSALYEVIHPRGPAG